MADEYLAIALLARLGTSTRLSGRVYHLRAPQETTGRYVVYRLSMGSSDDLITQPVTVTLDFWGYDDDLEVYRDRAEAHKKLNGWAYPSATDGTMTGLRQEFAEEVEDPEDAKIVHLHSVYNTEYRYYRYNHVSHGRAKRTYLPALWQR